MSWVEWLVNGLKVHPHQRELKVVQAETSESPDVPIGHAANNGILYASHLLQLLPLQQEVDPLTPFAVLHLNGELRPYHVDSVCFAVPLE